jgi:hypothetical protein
MGKLMNRLRSAVSSLGNVGAVANAEAVLIHQAASREAVEALELRMAIAADRRTLHAA